MKNILNEKCQNYIRKILLLEYEFDKRFKNFNEMESDFILFALPFKTNVNNASENLIMELINLQFDINLNQKFQYVLLLNFYSYLPINKFPQLRFFAIRLIALFGCTYICEQIFRK